MEQKKLSWMIAGLFALPAAVFAQQAAPAPADEVAVVTVTGIRASVRNALATKEASNSMVEVIASEDIGKLPDTTIAESLARLPGLSSGMDRGNASQIVARGLGPRFIGATLNGRELASSEPNRAVRFEQFPSESLSGATVYKTQSAELVEGGIATTIDLQTVQPLKYNGRQASLKADALVYELARDIPGADKVKPRVGGIYIDQFNNKTLGVALAFSYQDQPSLQKNTRHWGFNENAPDAVNSATYPGKAPWGFQDEVKRGTDERASVLGKVEWKAGDGAMMVGDVYYAQAKIREPGLQHWTTGDSLGNWGGWHNADFSNVDLRNGYVAGATVQNMGVVNNDYLWIQDMSTLAGGINGKFNAGAWKLEADLSTSRSDRDSQWRDLRQYSKTTSPLTFSFTGNENPTYDFGQDTGNPANFWPATMYVDTDGHLKDELSAVHLNGSRAVDLGPVSRVKFGARFTDREKNYHQTTWNLALQSAIPDSAYETINVPGMAPFIALKDFMGTTSAAFGSNVFDPSGRAQNQNDLLSGWKVTERSASMYAQAELEGEMFGKSFRGNAGLRVVRTRQTGEGMESLNGAAPSAVSAGTTYTEVLPSVNLIFNMDAQQERQVRFSVARAMARAPLDEMRGSRNLFLDTSSTTMPYTGSAGNPELKPMLANQVDLAYQWYFGKGSLLSGGLFYKQIERYIGITVDSTVINGRTANISRSVNGEGGNMRGLELVYQQSFANGFGVSSNYSYTASDIQESVAGGKPEGLMKHNGGITGWYERAGYEARISANYHSAFTRNPTWNAGALIENGAETWVGANFSKQITPNVQLRFGIENLTNQKVVYTASNNPLQQEVSEFGRRYNLGLTFKL